MSTITNRDRIPPSAAPPIVTPAPQSRSGYWKTFRRTVPTVAVVAALLGLALWGYTADWKLPKFSALAGDEAAVIDDWCADHNVPDSQCIECHPNLKPPLKDYGWCKEHGIPQCPLEHPDVAQLKIIPAISGEDLERASRALAVRPRAENNSRCKLHEKRIQFASVEALERVGVDIAIVQQRPIIEAVIANGEV